MPVYPIQMQIIAVGKLRQTFWQEAAAEYIRRLRHYVKLEVIETRDLYGRDRNEPKALKDESQEIARHLRDGAFVVLLDQAGKQMTSEQLAAFIRGEIEKGRRFWQFIVGGPAGVAPDLRSDLRLSLSAMTLPHEMARVVLLEQAYRAFSILRGEKYHK